MKPLIVGVAGGSGSGKSTVARKLAAALADRSVAAVDLDAYYRDLTHLSLDERRALNWDHPDALDFELFAQQLRALAERRAIEKPVYDYVTHLRAPHTLRVEPAEVVVVDGVLLFVDARLRDMLDLRVFVDTEPDLRLARRIRRDMRVRGRAPEEILDQYLSTVRPMHLEFVEPTRPYAHVILPHGGHDEGAIEQLAARVRRLLAERA